MSVAKGIAYGSDPFADFEAVGVAQGHGLELAIGLDPQQGDVQIRVLADDLGGNLVFVISFGELDFDLIGARDDVVVGQDGPHSLDRFPR